MILRSLAIAAAVALPAAAGGDLATPFADIPNVTVAFYDVAGRDAAAIRRSIDAARPKDPNDGTRVDGLTKVDVRWRWRDNAKGKCATTLDDVVFSATVTIPRLADGKVSGKVRDQFDRYVQSLLAHEDGHVRYAWEHRGDIATAINGATCATAAAAAQAAFAKIAAHDVAYDKTTRHGAATVLPFP